VQYNTRENGHMQETEIFTVCKKQKSAEKNGQKETEHPYPHLHPHTNTHTSTRTRKPKRNKNRFKMGIKKLLAPIMVNQYNKRRVAKRGINGEKEIRR
jgi:hypothetical protein